MKLETKILNLIENCPFAVIGSIDEEDYPNLKAMLPPRKREGLKTFYFSTNTSSYRVTQYLNNNKASIYFFDQEEFQGVMLKGNMEVLTDQNIKNTIWRNGDEPFYQKGITDEDYCGLKFTTIECRYYDNLKTEIIKI